MDERLPTIAELKEEVEVWVLRKRLKLYSGNLVKVAESLGLCTQQTRRLARKHGFTRFKHGSHIWEHHGVRIVGGIDDDRQ